MIVALALIRAVGSGLERSALPSGRRAARRGIRRPNADVFGE
jgi:hypothetical protein